MVEPVTIDFFREFKIDACTNCGLCLENCPIIDYDIESAKSEMRRLIAGKKTKKLLRDCQSCFTCNLYCPHDARPASLVLQRWNEQYEKEGLKIRGKYFMTLYPNYPNFRSYAADRYNEEEQQIVQKWRSLEPLKGDTLTYPGCNIILTPTLTQTSLFDELDIRGRLEYCCGETLFRTGYRKELFQVTKRLDKWFDILKPKNLLVLCTAGANVFRNVLPHYGLTYKFEKITPYIEWLGDKFEKGEVKVTNPLNMTVTVQDSCYSKMFGDAYMDLTRELLEKIGCKIIEMKHNRENMTCCGIGGGFSVDSAYNGFKMRKATAKNLDEAQETGADATCVICSGCLQQYNTSKNLYMKKTPPIYHIIELIQLAIGETPKRLAKRTGKNMFWGIWKHQMPHFISPRKFKLPDIPEDPAEDAY
jgi:Fe-S oxidoreductase